MTSPILLDIPESFESDRLLIRAPRPGDGGALQEAIDKTVTRAYDYVQGMTEGHFPLTREDRTDKSCTYCAYKRSCRVAEATEYGTLPRAPKE